MTASIRNMRILQERRERAEQLGRLIADGKGAAERVAVAAQESERAAMIVSAVAIIALVLASVALVKVFILAANMDRP
jgi:hypothetical protein